MLEYWNIGLIIYPKGRFRLPSIIQIFPYLSIYLQSFHTRMATSGQISPQIAHPVHCPFASQTT